jgi:D-beta-D-heptose 7-phosphate kinase / D-beta-D-heptose 1-phosphate adenosyltransferase
MNYQYIKTLLKNIKNKNPNILVIGDIMLDHYITGDVKRISPEAPVPVLNYKTEKKVLGGAGNVASNLSNLGAKVSIGSIIGDDESGDSIKKLLKDINASSSLIINIDYSHTTKKTRFISQGIQLLRLDNDSSRYLPKDIVSMENKILKNIVLFDCLIISDYDKGVCSVKTIKKIINRANEFDVPVYVDPKGSDWGKYENATSITPNKKEIENELNVKLVDDIDFEKAGKEMIDKLQLQSCLITRGSKGMTYVDKDITIHQKVNKKEVFDVSGAGDTVIACFAACSVSKIKVKEFIELSSDLSSEVVTHVGTIPFSLNMIEKKYA